MFADIQYISGDNMKDVVLSESAYERNQAISKVTKHEFMGDDSFKIRRDTTYTDEWQDLGR